MLGGGGQAQGWGGGAVKGEAAKVGRDPNVDRNSWDCSQCDVQGLEGFQQVES